MQITVYLEKKFCYDIRGRGSSHPLHGPPSSRPCVRVGGWGRTDVAACCFHVASGRIGPHAPVVRSRVGLRGRVLRVHVSCACGLGHADAPTRVGAVRERKHVGGPY